MEIYVVSRGDTLFSVSRRYGLRENLVAAQNGIAPETPLVVGQTLVLLNPTTVHTAAEGETIASIAALYGVSENRIYRNNINLKGEPDINPGDKLVITYAETPDATISVYGYAYPFINKSLLRTVLPYNTALVPFTYGITASGELVLLSDEELIRIAESYGTAPYMHLSTLTETGGFDSALADVVLNDGNARAALIENIVALTDEKGYLGLDVDFEYVPARNADAYAEFVAELRERLNAEGREVIVALAPKTSAAQKGLLYEGHNYGLLGAAANRVLLMTYEWGYTYGPPLAVAPIPNVRSVIDYAVSVIPREKIYLGIPNYGYDWTLPFVSGESRAQSISNERALELARTYGAEISFDELSRSPYFFYTAPDGRRHEVHFEDARSISAKLSLIREYSLYGAGYWNLMRPFAQNYTLLNSVYNIRR